MTNDTRTPDEIEREIERERAGLTDTLDELQNKFSVETIARQFSDHFREHGGDIGRSVSEAVKRNPVALALTGVGLAWMMLGKKSESGHSRLDADTDNVGLRSDRDSKDHGPVGSVRQNNSRPTHRPARNPTGTAPTWARRIGDNDDNGDADDESLNDRAAALFKQLSEGTETLSDQARDRVMYARRRAVEASDTVRDCGRQGRERALDLFEQQPLIAGALAVAVGAAVGAALPRSRTEDHYFGEQSDELLDEAERIFDEEKAKLANVAKAATGEAGKIVKQAKKDADRKAPANATAEAIADKATASGKRIADAARSEAKRQKLGDVNN